MLQLKKVIRDLSRNCKHKEMLRLIRLFTEAHKFEIGSVRDLLVTVQPKPFSTDINMLGTYTEDTFMPYPECWFEYVLDVESYDDITDITKAAVTVAHRKCCIYMFKAPEDSTSDVNKISSTVVWHLPEDDEWFLSPITTTIYIDEKGVAVSNGFRNKISPPSVFADFNEEAESRFNSHLTLSTLLLFNYRGIDKLLEPKKSKPFNKKQRRKLKTPDIFSYKILKLTHSSGPVTPSIPQGGKNRQHGVRAHTHTYTKERPLFGKFVGTVIIPAHKRGDIELGFVAKSYKV